MPAAAGIGGVLVVYGIGLRLWRSASWAAMAAALVALDGLHLVQSRVAMLDIFVATLLSAAFLTLLADLERDGHSGHHGGDRWWGSRLRIATGLLLGMAVSVKWSAAYVAPVLVALAWAGDRRRGVGRRALLPLLFVTALVYLVAYGQFFWQHGPDVPAFVRLQWAMYRHGVTRTGVAAGSSSPWTWPLNLHPMTYYDTAGVHIVASGNVALWWSFLILGPVAAVTAVRRRTAAEVAVVGCYLAVFLPWLFAGRTSYLYYMTPAVPFMALATVAGLRVLRRPPVGWSLVVAAAVVTAASAPGLYGL
jgi:dolichyl-phosphate-mannose--protein O-mannosyl transferase